MISDSERKIREFKVTLIGIGGHAIALVNQCLFQQFLKSGHLHKQCVFIDCEKSSFSGLICGTNIELGADYELSHRQIGEIDEILSRTDLTCFILAWPQGDEERIAGDIAEIGANDAPICAAIIFLADRYESIDEAKVTKIKNLAQKIDRVLIVENRFDTTENIRSVEVFKKAIKILLYILAQDGPFLIKKPLKGLYLVNFITIEKTENIFAESSRENTVQESNRKWPAETHLELLIDHKTEIRVLAEILDKLKPKIPDDASLEFNFLDMPGEVILFTFLKS